MRTRKDRLLPWIAAERAFRTVVLVAVGVVLVSHPHANWSSEITHLSRQLGLDPNGNWIRKLIEKLRKLHTSENTGFGVIALAYAALEGTAAYGLWRRRPWPERRTVVATALLLVPWVWWLTKGPTALKVCA